MPSAIPHPDSMRKVCAKCGFSERATLERVHHRVNPKGSKYRKHTYRGERSFGLWINNQCPRCHTETKRKCQGHNSRHDSAADNIRVGWESEVRAKEYLESLGYDVTHNGGQGAPDLVYEREGELRRVEVKTISRYGRSGMTISKHNFDFDEIILILDGSVHLVPVEDFILHGSRSGTSVTNVIRFLEANKMRAKKNG